MRNGFLGVLTLLMALAASPVSAAVLPDPAVDAHLVAASGSETIVLAGGCFWGIEAVFEHVKGVRDATAGYAGGEAATAHYDLVSNGDTGHAESVRVTYDPSQITFGQLLKIYFSVAHDPTELNRQGPDHGTQYRSAIFYTSPAQQEIAQGYITQLRAAKAFGAPIVTEITPLKVFYPAEDYHQHYADLHPDNFYILINDLPKIAHLEKQFPDLYEKK